MTIREVNLLESQQRRLTVELPGEYTDEWIDTALHLVSDHLDTCNDLIEGAFDAMVNKLEEHGITASHEVIHG